MPRTALRPDALQGKVFRGRFALANGLLTADQLRSCAWRRLYHGVYADAALPVDHGLRIAAARLVMPKQAVVAGRSAGWLYGATDLVGNADPVEVLVDAEHRFGPVRGLRIRRVADLRQLEVDTTGRVRCTKPVRTALDIARWAPDLSEAVVAIDLLMARGVATPLRLAEAAAALSPARGRTRIRQAVQLADGRSESPQESRLRMMLVLAGLPTPEPQYHVRHNGRFIARVDLAYPEHRIAIEYDGRWHDVPARFGADRRRLSALAAAGWRVIVVTAADLHHPDRLIATARAALLGAA